MTITADGATVRRMTRQQLQEAIDQLVREARLSRQELQDRGDAFELDGELRGILAEIEGYEWLLSRHP